MQVSTDDDGRGRGLPEPNRYMRKATKEDVQRAEAKVKPKREYMQKAGPKLLNGLRSAKRHDAYME